MDEEVAPMDRLANSTKDCLSMVLQVHLDYQQGKMVPQLSYY